jgi:hypothetical protein
LAGGFFVLRRSIKSFAFASVGVKQKNLLPGNKFCILTFGKEGSTKLIFSKQKLASLNLFYRALQKQFKTSSLQINPQQPLFF